MHGEISENWPLVSSIPEKKIEIASSHVEPKKIVEVMPSKHAQEKALLYLKEADKLQAKLFMIRRAQALETNREESNQELCTLMDMKEQFLRNKAADILSQSKRIQTERLNRRPPSPHESE